MSPHIISCRCFSDCFDLDVSVPYAVGTTLTSGTFPMLDVTFPMLWSISYRLLTLRIVELSSELVVYRDDYLFR